MEGRKKKSLATDLFGEKDSRPAGSSSSEILGSIFGNPPNKVYGRENPSKTEKGTGNPAWNTKNDNNAVVGEGQGSKSSINSHFLDEKTPPFHYSSSIYYGGQDIYHPPPEPSKSPVFSTFNKDGGEDDPGTASRGNWWQGSLYY
ncbi:Encodes a protein involved in salt tolerance-names SIS (Salt Induced Serine rich) [Striga hermonthica]|uniref:Encodes a protein involved in salt tolerance-names SIS (Salt Induced Serine rich) n=1 Tax=Striga hermonthica TaxID=68872 RepID=A0A9N7RI62_STRHE|nr:Encodes a protein involved in salt tolerance-names SIS (Salt Induced Serine rich) [Striga hermonthica]